VHFQGQRIDQLSERARTLLRRDRFGFVFQFGQLVPELPAVENVMLPLILSGVRRSAARVRSTELLDRLELTGLEARLPGELSGGQAQRVAVARALVSRPEAVFADEPTGSLDSLSGQRVMDLLVDAARGQGTAVVLVTHEARVAACADREVVVRDGRANALVTP
jgi:putative ABC transport system ATP-binding protein